MSAEHSSGRAFSRPVTSGSGVSCWGARLGRWGALAWRVASSANTNPVVGTRSDVISGTMIGTARPAVEFSSHCSLSCPPYVE